jgi:hypothetical protein
VQQIAPYRVRPGSSHGGRLGGESAVGPCSRITSGNSTPDRRLDATEADAVGHRLGYWLGLAIAPLTNSWEPGDVHHLHVSSLGAGVNGAFLCLNRSERRAHPQATTVFRMALLV